MNRNLSYNSSVKKIIIYNIKFFHQFFLIKSHDRYVIVSLEVKKIIILMSPKIRGIR